MAKPAIAALAAIAAALPTAPYATLEPVRHNGKRYPKGNTVHLNVKDAEKLLASGSVLTIRPDTSARDVNDEINLKELTQEQLVAHATERYSLTIPAESTTEAILEAIANARAAAAQAS